jgi:hypothetical protein
MQAIVRDRTVQEPVSFFYFLKPTIQMGKNQICQAYSIGVNRYTLEVSAYEFCFLITQNYSHTSFMNLTTEPEFFLAKPDML